MAKRKSKMIRVRFGLYNPKTQTGSYVPRKSPLRTGQILGMGKGVRITKRRRK